MNRSNHRSADNNQPFVLVESNLEILPIFRVTGRNKDTTPYTLTWSGTMNDGSIVNKSWTVEPHSQYGAPRGRDQDVFIAVLSLIEKRGGMPEEGVVSTTRAELLNILGWPTNGSHYQKLRESLTRIDRTLIASRDAFYHQDTETWLDGSFRIWGVEFLTSRRRKDGRSEERVVIRFADVLIRSFLAAYLKGLDTEFYWSLSSHLAKRMYRLVDRMRGKRIEWEENLFKLQERVPIGPYHYPSQIRQKLSPAHGELVEKGFLEYAEFNEATLCVRYRVSDAYAHRRERFELAESTEGLLAMEIMGRVGMTVTEAHRLVAEYGPERCLACAQALPFQKIKKSSLAWMRWAVKESEFDPYPYLGGEKGRVDGDLVGEMVRSSRGKEGRPGGPTQLQLGGSESLEVDPPEPESEALAVWEKVLEDAASEINAPSLGIWFEGAVPVALEGEILTLSAPNSVAKEYIESRFKAQLQRCLSELLGSDACIEVTAREGGDHGS